MKIELNGRKKRSRAIKKRRSEGGVAGEGAWPRAKRNYAATGWVGGWVGGGTRHTSRFSSFFFLSFFVCLWCRTTFFFVWNGRAKRNRMKSGIKGGDAKNTRKSLTH